MKPGTIFTPMELVVSASGCLIYKDANAYNVIRERATYLPVVKYLFLLLTAIPMMAGISQFFRIKDDPDSLMAGIILLCASAVFGLILYLVQRYQQKIKNIPPAELSVLFIIDRNANELQNSDGTKLDVLSNVSVARKFRATSSSKKLVLNYSGGSIVIAKGSPFAGGTASLEDFFKRAGLM